MYLSSSSISILVAVVVIGVIVGFMVGVAVIKRMRRSKKLTINSNLIIGELMKMWQWRNVGFCRPPAALANLPPLLFSHQILVKVSKSR